MQLILSDLPKNCLDKELFCEDCKFVFAPQEAEGCCGCFRCWFEHPGSCVKSDPISDFSADMGRCDRLLIVTKNTYGSYSPPVKRVLERSISFVRPSFTIRHGEMHHKRRYKKDMSLAGLFYGPSTDKERCAARRLMQANALNMCARAEEPRFADTPAGQGGTL